MSFLIQEAWAEGQVAAPGGGNVLMEFLPLIILFVVFYFLLIRPQMKRAKEHREMVTSLAKGDEVITSGGLLGRITNVGDNFVVLEVSQDVEVKVQKQAISSVVPKGTSKTL